MIITRDFLDGYGAQLEVLGDAAESEAVARLSVRWLELRDEGVPLEDVVALMRDEAAFVLANNDSTYGVASVAVGMESLDSMIAEDFDAYGSYDVVPRISRSDESSARYWAKFLDGTDEGFERFLSGICAKTRRNVTHMADGSVAETAVNLNRSRKKRGGGVRFARVPSGPSCGFCIMLASRGFVYATRETAGEFTEFHDNCDCRIVAETERTEVEGYDPDELYKRYLMCRESIEHDVKPSWDAMTPDEQKSWGKKTRDNKDAFNNYFARRVSQEMDTRDREWLWSGRIPEVTFANETLRLEIENERPHELDVARHLSDKGIRSHFVIDHRTEVDKVSGQEYTIGLSDLEGGIELKALIRANGKGAIDRVLRDASHKEDLRICVIDNSWKRLDDDIAEEEIRYRMPKRHVKKCIFIKSDGSIVRITVNK